jgi:trans-2,3-dihydro-3-hydroxyanthranilate isomerase
MKRRFVTLDVFTNRRFTGNPLAVVLDTDGLDRTMMQAVAREFNLSETVFVLPAKAKNHRASLRIFTPATELPFAGHPTIGTAVLLNRLDGGSTQEFAVEEGVGPIQCTTNSIDDDCGRARFHLLRLPEETREIGSREAIAAALSLSADAIGFDEFRPSCWSAGVVLNFVPVSGLEAIGRCRVNEAEWEKAFGRDGPSAVYVFCRETIEAGSSFHARMFAPRLGINEDPATGAAVAAFSGALVRFAPPPDGDHDLWVEQGYEMGRPSRIGLSVRITNQQLAAAAISGEAIVVSEGVIEA